MASHDIDSGISGDAHAAPDQRREKWRAPTQRGSIPGFQLSMHARGGRRTSRRLSLQQSGATTDDKNAGDDASELGTIHHILHGKYQSIPDGMDIAFPALHAGSGSETGRSRRPHPPSSQGDHRPTEEASALPLPAPESQRRQPECCRQLCVLRQRSMGEIKPPRDAEGLSAVMVRRTGGLAQSDVERSTPAAGFGPARAGVLKYRSKEPDAWPACPVL